jgi:hypothetical protein
MPVSACITRPHCAHQNSVTSIGSGASSSNPIVDLPRMVFGVDGGDALHQYAQGARRDLALPVGQRVERGVELARIVVVIQAAQGLPAECAAHEKFELAHGNRAGSAVIRPSHDGPIPVPYVPRAVGCGNCAPLIGGALPAPGKVCPARAVATRSQALRKDLFPRSIQRALAALDWLMSGSSARSSARRSAQ